MQSSNTSPGLLKQANLMTLAPKTEIPISNTAY